jgi:organic radical activating enzyme
VKPERLAEGMNPRHCALSLVGEPIMYPEINTLVKELHKRRISTFLVTNAQFPERITALEPITQVKMMSLWNISIVQRTCQGRRDFIANFIRCYIDAIATYAVLWLLNKCLV